MKIKNIFNTAFLKLWLVLFALVPAIAAVMIAATHTPTDPQPNKGSSVKDNLSVLINNLVIDADDFQDVKANSYYDNDTWYFKNNGVSDLNISTRDSKNCFDTKQNRGFAFLLGEGSYKITVNYLAADNTRGVRIYKSDDPDESSSYKFEMGPTDGSFKDANFDVTVEPGATDCWWVSGYSSSSYIHSISVTKKEPLSPILPSDIETISTDKFWYHNGDYGFSRNGLVQPFYRYFNQSSDPYAPTSGKKVLINNQEHESYTIASGDGIGFKLDNKAYRIKVYYDNSGAVPELCWGEDISTASVSQWSPASPSEPTKIRDGGGSVTSTRLITYEVPNWLANNKGYCCWIKNGDSNNSVYLAGFEILPYGGSVSIPDQTFTGIRWYVEDYAASVGNANGGADVQVAQGGNNVVIDGPSMAINSFTIGLEKDAEGKDIPKKTVMLNENSKIGVNLPAGATLKFVYCHDDGVSLKITDNDGNKLTPQKDKLTDYVFNEVEYTTTDDQKVWLTGEGSDYVYIPGFLVDNPNASIEYSINDVLPITSDYVWYAMENRPEIKDKSLVGTGNHVYVDHGFSDAKLGEGFYLDINSRKNTAYRVEGGSKIGFKIAKGKKGVINAYMGQEKNYTAEEIESWFQLKESNDNKEGSRVSRTIQKIGGTIYAQYYFDTTGGEKTYWMVRSNSIWFGGFEVLFEEGNNGGIDLASGTYNCNGNSTVTNAISDDTYYILKSSNTTPVVGPSMLVNPLTEGDGVMLYTRGSNQNAIMFKMTGTTYNAVTVKGVITNGASIKIYKGSPSGTLLGTLTSTGSQTFSLGEGKSDSDVYYAVSNDDAGAYLISLAPATINENQLLPITADNIYKVNNQPADGQILNDKHTIFKGSVDAVDENGMMVLGKNNKAFQISNKQDYYGFKVGTSVNGAKTGYIKVYFKKGTNDECFDGNPETLCHKMEELPIDQPLGAGWNSSYDEKEHIITFNGEGGGRGWWFGTGNNNGTPRDLSIYNKINIELGTVTGSPNLKLVVQDSIGAGTSFKLDSNGRLTGDLTDQSKWFKSDDGKTFDIHKVSQIYIQDINGDNTTATVEIKSARLMRKPLTIATGTVGTDQKGDETYSTDNLTEVFGGIIHDVQGTHVYAYPFDLSKTDDNPQLYWVTGNINIAAIEVVYDDNNHFKVVDWYVNKDTKMIVGSDDPNWVWSGFDDKGSIGYPEGDYDEYVTFYISNGRPAHVSFIMPEAVAEVYDWESNNANYGKHVITPSKVTYNGKSEQADLDKITLDTNGTKYDRTNQKSDRKNIGTKDTEAKLLYSWYSYDREISSKNNENCYMDIAVTATQKPAPGDTKWKNEDIENVQGKKGEWKILMRFISYKSPEIGSADINENSKKVGETITVTRAGQGGDIYYTSDSSDPVNIAGGINVAHTSTKEYGNTAFEIKKNCIVKAAQYLTTTYEFYEDATLQTNTSKSMKLVSEDHNVVFDLDNVVYVKDQYPDPFRDEKPQLFNRQDGGYMLTLPTGDKIDCKDKDGKIVEVNAKKFDEKGELEGDGKVAKHEQAFSASPNMYLTLGGKDWPYLNGNSFGLCGTNWKASNDGGLKTYLDSYQSKFDVDGLLNVSPWPDKDDEGNDLKQNQNPYTECNGGVGGADTEAGGMFLQPIGGTMLRFEPEYDGVITVWLRQNGCLDNNTQELGTFSRRPVYIMDENGRIMTRTTIKPTDEHYLGINGTWAINSNMCEERSQVEHTWLFAVAKQVFEKHPRYAERFKNFPNRWTMRDKYMTDDNSRGGAIMYGWWYKGFSINATTEDITSADFGSRYEYMDPNLLYRSNNVFDMEMNTLGLKNNFAKYGYELPNFQYVRYQIPVKAGKTYYIAGRGTKNGFSAIRFDRVKCNTNLNADDFNALRFSDNPSIYENTEVGKRDANYLKLKENWNDIGSDDSSVPTEKDINDSYVAVNNNSARYAVVTMNTENIDGEGKYEACEWFVKAIAGDAVSKNITGQPNLNGKTVQVILNRTFTAGNWHPIILPFSISETRLEQYFGEGTVVLYLDPYEHTVANPTGADGRTFISAYNAALDNSKLYFTRHRYEMLYANTPAFICPTFTWSDAKKKPATDNIRNNNLTWKDNNANGGVVVSIKFDRVTFDGSNINPDRKDGLYGYAINEEYEVVGSYDPQEISGDVYYIENYTQDGKPATQLKHSTKTNGTTVVMRPTRVWIQPIKSSGNIAPIRTVGAKTFSELDFDFDNEQAGISEIVADDITVERYINDNGVYDMLGRKMGEGSLDGLPSGVYIFKGQKVYVK